MCRRFVSICLGLSCYWSPWTSLARCWGSGLGAHFSAFVFLLIKAVVYQTHADLETENAQMLSSLPPPSALWTISYWSSPLPFFFHQICFLNDILRGQLQVLWEKGILRSFALPSNWLMCVKCPEGGSISRSSSGPVSPSFSFQSQSLWSLPRRESSSAAHPQPKHPATSQGECVLRLELGLEIPSRGFYCQLCCLRF